MKSLCLESEAILMLLITSFLDRRQYGILTHNRRPTQEQHTVVRGLEQRIFDNVVFDLAFLALPVIAWAGHDVDDLKPILVAVLKIAEFVAEENVVLGIIGVDDAKEGRVVLGQESSRDQRVTWCEA